MEDGQLRTPTYSTAIAVLVFALLAIGALMAASTSTDLDQPLLKYDVWTTPLGRHLLLVGLAVAALFGTARVTQWWLSTGSRVRLWTAFSLALVVIAALIAARQPGVGIRLNGARRWLRIGSDAIGLTFQPSELAKPAMIFAMVAVLSLSVHGARSWFRGFAPAALIVGVFFVLVGVEDFGTGALLACVGGLTLLAGGCRIWHCGIAAVPGIGALAYMVISEPYRLARLTAFRDVFADPQGAGYHPIQSMAAIVSGGWFGNGLGNGLQKYGFLPEAESDFIFSVICEEAGILGGIGVISLYACLGYVGMRVMQSAPTSAGRLIAFSVTLLITMQATINIAVATVSAPTKGIPLPLISAGGTGLVCLCGCLGLLMAVANHDACGAPASRELQFARTRARGRREGYQRTDANPRHPTGHSTTRWAGAAEGWRP